MGFEKLFARCEHGVDVESTVKPDLSRRRAHSLEGKVDVQQIFKCEPDILVKPVRTCCMRATGVIVISGVFFWGGAGAQVEKISALYGR